MQIVEPVDGVVVVLSGPGFYILDKCYKRPDLKTIIENRYPDIDVAIPGSPFEQFQPPHKWSDEQLKKTPFQRWCGYFGEKAGYNETVLAKALHAPLPPNKKRRVVLVLRYGFDAVVAATAYCASTDAIAIVGRVHEAGVKIGLPSWGLPVPFYFLLTGAIEELVEALSRNWTRGREDYVRHYVAMREPYFQPPQFTPYELHCGWSCDRMINFIGDNIPDIFERKLAMAA